MKSASNSKRSSLRLLLAAVCLGACSQEDMLSAKNEAKPVAPTAAATPRPHLEVATSISAERLAQAYDENEVAAQRDYGSQLLLVHGTVAAVTLDASDDPVIELFGGEYMPVSAHFVAAYKGRIADLSKGDRIYLACRSNSEVLASPVLDDCIFPDKPRFDPFGLEGAREAISALPNVRIVSLSENNPQNIALWEITVSRPVDPGNLATQVCEILRDNRVRDPETDVRILDAEVNASEPLERQTLWRRNCATGQRYRT